MNNQPETPLSLEHELALIRCQDYLQKDPQKAIPIPVFLTQKAIANWRRLTASMFDPDVNSVT